MAVAFGRVADHLVAAVFGEVHVNVRHLLALYVKEALEDEPVLQRVDVRDVQAVERDGGRCRAPQRHLDPLLVSVLRKVLHAEDVIGEPGLADDVQLVIKAAHGLFRLTRVAAPEAFPAELVEVLVRRSALRHLRLRDANVAELQRQVAHLGDLPRVVDSLGQVGEESAHLVLGLQAVAAVVARHPEAVFVLHVGVRADAEEDVLVGGVVRLDVMQVVRRDHRQPRLAGQAQQLHAQLLVLIDAVLLQLDVVVAEQLFVVVRRLHRVVEAAVQQASRNLAGGAAREHDEPFAVLLQDLAVHARAVVVALEVRLRRERQEVVVAGLVLGQHRQMVRLLRLRVAVQSRALRDVGFDADDRLDVALPRLFVELDRAVEDAVVRQADRLLAQLFGAVHQFRDAREAVEERELGVGVEVREHQRGRAGRAGMELLNR